MRAERRFFSYGLADLDGLILMILMGGVGIVILDVGLPRSCDSSQILQGFGPKNIFSSKLARPRRKRPTHSGSIFRRLLNIAVGLPRSCARAIFAGLRPKDIFMLLS